MKKNTIECVIYKHTKISHTRKLVSHHLFHDVIPFAIEVGLSALNVTRQLSRIRTFETNRVYLLACLLSSNIGKKSS